MSNFIYDGTSLPFPKVDLVPLGSAPANKYVASADWNTACQAMVDVQSFLRGGFQLFKSDDPSVYVPLLVLQGTPLISAAKGSLALDVTTPKLYQNTDGASTWTPFATGTGMTIGGSIGGGTAGSVLFVDTGPTMGQDNANFFWDTTNKRLGIGTATPAVTLDVVSAATDAAIALSRGSTAGVSAANKARIRYNESSQTLQVSLNGNGYVDIQTGAEYTLDIGDAIGSSTVGSVLFVGTGNILQQAATKLFFDNTNFRLGVGTATPATTLELASTGNATAILMSGGSTVGVSVGATARLRFNESTSKLQVSLAGGAYADIATGSAGMSIGGSIASATVGSVLFVGAGTVLQQDNANLFWDDTNNVLGIGTNAPNTGGRRLHVVANGSTAPVQLDTTVSSGFGSVVYTLSGASKGGSGYGGSTVTITALQNRIFLQSLNLGTGPDIVIAHADNTGGTVSIFSKNADGTVGILNTAPGTTLDVGVVGGTTTAVAWRGGSTAAVSAANTGRVRYNESTQQFQASRNTGAYLDVALNATTLVAGAVLFGTSTGTINQDSANLFWDNTGKRLGIGTASPTAGYALHVVTPQPGVGIKIDAGNLSSLASVDFYATGGSSQKGGVGYADTSQGSAFAGMNYFFCNGVDLAVADNFGINYRFAIGSTLVGLQLSDGSTASLSAANTGKIRYNTTGQKFQVSMNGAAYVDIATGSTAIAIGTSITSSTPGSVLFVGASNDLQQDNANLFWDNTNNRLGIGTASPTSALHVVSDTIALIERTSTDTSSAFGVLSIEHHTTGDMADGFGPTLLFRIHDNTSGSLPIAYIGAVRTNASDSDGDMVFAPYQGGNPIERMRLTYDGRLGIGTTPSVGALEVAGDAYFYAGTVRTTGGGSVYVGTSGELRTDQIQHSTSPGGTTAIDIMVPINVHGALNLFGLDGSNNPGQVYFNAINSPNNPSLDFQYSANSAATGYINDKGYQAGTTQFRSLEIRDGKGATVAFFDGSTKGVSLGGTGSPAANSVAIVGGLEVTTSSSENIYFGGNRETFWVGGVGVTSMGTNYNTNGAATMLINDVGYNGGITQFRNLEIHNGKGATIAVFTGSTKQTDLSGPLGQKVHANFAGSDAIATTAAVQTTTTTQTTLFSFTLSDNNVYRFEAEIIARDEAGTERALYGKIVLVYRQGGGATIQGSVQDIHPDVETSAGLDVTWTVSTNDVRLSVTGLAATTIDWVAAIRYQAVATNA